MEARTLALNIVTARLLLLDQRPIGHTFFFNYMRLMLILQLILYENITDMYKSDYNRDQHTSMLMERCPDFNPLKYSRNVYSSHWGKEADCLHSILFEEGNTPHALWGFELLLSKLESSSSHHSAKGHFVNIPLNSLTEIKRKWTNATKSKLQVAR